MSVRLLVAAAENDVIGRGGELPWHLRGDLRRFAALTRGHAVVMGRLTHESILARLGHPLPGRHSIVVTSHAVAAPLGEGAQHGAGPDGVQLAGSPEQAAALAAEHSATHGLADWFVIGGASVYRQLLPAVDVVDLTRVHAEPDGDVRMPAGWLDGFTLVSTEPAADDDAEYPYSFQQFHRDRVEIR